MGGYLVGDYQSQDFSTVDDVVVVSLGSGRCFACTVVVDGEAMMTLKIPKTVFSSLLAATEARTDHKFTNREAPTVSTSQFEIGTLLDGVLFFEGYFHKYD
jgi:hypothetical protein